MASVKGSVLIVDVYGAYRWALRAAFTQIGLDVDEAEDGEAAIERFTRNTYDVVLIGMNLRQLDGPSTVRELRALPNGADATIVALADDGDTSMIAAALAMGANEFVPRFTSISVVQKRIEYMALCASARRSARGQLSLGAPSSHLTPRTRRRCSLDDVTFRYEPRIDAASYQVTGFETIAHRADVPRNSDSFLSMADRHGFIVELGERMMRQACRDVASLRDTTGLELRATVPVTVMQMSESKFLGRVAEALECADAEPGWLELELGEMALLEAEREVGLTLRVLQEMGVGVALADFGSSHTSFDTLKRFPLASLRLPRAFVRDVVTHPDGALILKSIAQAAHGRGQRVIADGIDVAEHLDFLTGLGCDELQGPFVGAPLTFAELFEWVRCRTAALDASKKAKEQRPTRRPTAPNSSRELAKTSR